MHNFVLLVVFAVQVFKKTSSFQLLVLLECVSQVEARWGTSKGDGATGFQEKPFAALKLLCICRMEILMHISRILRVTMKHPFLKSQLAQWVCPFS